jgi:hypothetical protein
MAHEQCRKPERRYPAKFIAATLIPTKKTIIDPTTLHVNLYELFDNRSFAGLLILEFDMVDERCPALGIGSKSMYVAPIGKCFRIDVCANSYIANTLNLFALSSDKSFPVFIRGGHILGIGKDRKRSAVSKLILEPGNSYDVVHSDTSFRFMPNCLFLNSTTTPGEQQGLFRHP